MAAFMLLAFLVSWEPAHGQCVIFEDPADLHRVADAVFIGTVRKSEPTGARGFHIVMHRVWFEIEGIWKGRVEKLETVGTVEAFEPGKRYLVFAGASPERSRSGEGSLTTSLECGWAEIEDEASPKLLWLYENVGKPRKVGDK
jgi:hypothetical protein